MSNQWSDNLRKRMEVHQEPSPEGLWEDIEQAMEQSSSIINPAKRNKVIVWSERIGAIAAVLLLLFFIGYYFIKETPPKSIVQTIQIPDGTEETLPLFQEERRKGEGHDSDDVFSETKNNTFITTKRTLADSLSNEDKVDLIAKAEQKEEHKEGSFQSSSDMMEKEQKDYSNSGKDDKNYTNRDDSNLHLRIDRKRDKSAKWETSIYASNIPSEAKRVHDGYGGFTSRENSLEIEGDEPDLDENPYEAILYENKYKEVYTDVKHKQPVTVGVSLRYNLDEKWSLTSGLTYTILVSELRSGSDNYYYTSEQTLHNVGIPLNVNYNLWKNKMISVYASGGGLVEKNVSGKLATEYIIDNNSKSMQKDEISVDQLQWSVNTSVGVQCNLSQKVGLYAEPGVSFYFKNGSEIETIYKEKPLSLSLKIGLRFSLNN